MMIFRQEKKNEMKGNAFIFLRFTFFVIAAFGIKEKFQKKNSKN